MSSKSAVILVAGLVVLAVGCAAGRIPTQAQSGLRAVVVHPRRTIRELLLPEDKVVVLVHDDDIVVEHPTPRPKDALRLQLAMGRWSTVAVVKVNDAASSLDDTGTWVNTDLRVTVEEVLRPVAEGDAPLGRGDSIDVRVSGGEVAIDGVTVRTGDAPRFAMDRSYLLDLGPRDTMGRRLNSLGIAMMVTKNNRLESIRSAPFVSNASPLDGLSLTDAREVVSSSR
jgi:hypothetical protein